MKRTMLVLSIMLLSLSLAAQKADFKTSFQGVQQKLDAYFSTDASGLTQPQKIAKLDDLNATIEKFIASYYPNGFDKEDFNAKVQTLSKGFLPDCAACVGFYIACMSHCSGGCYPCHAAFAYCYNACQGPPAISKPELAKTR